MTLERDTDNERDVPSAHTILVVDVDVTVCDSLAAALGTTDFVVRSARSGGEAIATAIVAAPSLVLIDAVLANSNGLALLDVFATTPSIIMSDDPGLLQDVRATRGVAVEVFQKPIDVDNLVERIQAMIREHEAGTLASREAHEPGATRSAAERWAWFVITACTARRDLKTLSDWARHVGVSYSTLAESSRIVGLRPHDARDFARGLRAVIRARLEGCPIDVLLDVRDRRTLRTLLLKTGLDLAARGPHSVEDYLARQMFVPPDNEGMRALRRALRPSRAPTERN